MNSYHKGKNRYCRPEPAQLRDEAVDSLLRGGFTEFEWGRKYGSYEGGQLKLGASYGSWAGGEFEEYISVNSSRAMGSS